MCSLNKTLYGLKEAPHTWFDQFSQFLLHIGFFYNTTNPSLFIHYFTCDTILLLIYVDDMIHIGNNKSYLDWFSLQLSKEFSMKDLGPLHYFLGIEVQRNNNGLFLCQSKYTHDLLIYASKEN